MENIPYINEIINGKTETEAIKVLSEKFPRKIVFSTSLSYEDQVITHFIYSNNLPVKIFTLETGRLFNETLELLDATNLFYKKHIEVFYPKQEVVDKLINEKGLTS